MTDPTKRFSDRVAFYVRSRPKYPAELLRFFQDEFHLSPAQPIADIGSGTGFLTELFVRNGNPTFAVEPNNEMRFAAEAFLGNSPNFHSISGTAEATTLADASVDFITAGQAFHWFKPIPTKAEFQRILKPRGIVALVWNQRRNYDSAFGTEYQAMIERYATDHDAVRARSTSATEDSTLAPFFGPAGYQCRTFDNPQMLDRTGMIDRIASSSYMPLADHPKHGEMLAAANEIFDRHQQAGAIQIPQETEVYFRALA